MSKKVEISKVVITIGDSTHELTLNQARELQEALAGLFGRKETVIEKHIHDYIWPEKPTPIWTEPLRDWITYTIADTNLPCSGNTLYMTASSA